MRSRCAALGTINDILDRDLDAQVERTRARPLPGGAVTLQQALLWLALQSAFGALVLFQLPPLAIALGIGSLLLVECPPADATSIRWPQLMLGLTFNWASRSVRGGDWWCRLAGVVAVWCGHCLDVGL